MSPTVAGYRKANHLILHVPVVAVSLDTEEVRGSSPPGPTILQLPQIFSVRFQVDS